MPRPSRGSAVAAFPEVWAALGALARRRPVAAALAFWTLERMLAARPMPVPEAPAPAGPPPPVRLRDALARAAAGARPTGQPLWETIAGRLRAALTGVPVATDHGPPDAPVTVAAGSYETVPVGDRYTQFPYSAIGKLFMTFPAGQFVGSAWVIGERMVFTAGHCLYDHQAGGAAKSVVFVGGYKNGQSVGQWAVANKAVPNAWKNDRNFVADMGIAILDAPVRPVLGKLGFRMNLSPPCPGAFTELGYPAQAPFDGTEMWQTVGQLTDYPTPVSNGSGVVRAGGNQTGGTSGGPWCDAADGFRAVGLNSHHQGGDPNHMCSPYLGDHAIELIDWAIANGGDDP